MSSSSEPMWGEVVFDVDMNDADEAGHISALTSHSTAFPLIPTVTAGQKVRVRDEMGGTYAAVVSAVRGRIVEMTLSWATFRNAGVNVVSGVGDDQ